MFTAGKIFEQLLNAFSTINRLINVKFECVIVFSVIVNNWWVFLTYPNAYANSVTNLVRQGVALTPLTKNTLTIY